MPVYCNMLLIPVTFSHFYYLIVQGDVYPVEPYEGSSMNQVLDAHWGVLDDEDVSFNIISLDKSIIQSVLSSI